MKKLISSFLVLFAVAFPFLVFALDGGTDAGVAAVEAVSEVDVVWWKVLLGYAMELGFTVVAILVSGLVTVLLKKYGFETQTAKINDILDRSISWAEQEAKKAAKLDGKLDSESKMEMAKDFAVSMAEEYNIKGKSSRWWENRLESWLNVKNK
jgi:mannose/fructose/N-acetylgalactosamine-specific phosphotransferase system component IID